MGFITMMRCVHCGQTFQCLAWQEGMRLPCPHCRQIVQTGFDAFVESREGGREEGSTGWDVTFSDFKTLTTDADFAAHILPLLHTFGLERVQVDPLQFQDRQGVLLSAEEAHARIQNDPGAQFEIYQAAYPLFH